MFLHENLIHLAGNMLFLWLFGASVEGRVRPLQFLAIYFVSGLAGGLLSDLVMGGSHPETFSLGASGAIMGLGGAYLYMFPYSLICVFWRFGWLYGGVMEWQARWVVALYVGLDLLAAFVFQSQDGVGHFAHLGGFATGLLCAFLLRAPRDSEDMSYVQAALSETKDYSLLSLNDLEILIHRSGADANVMMAYLEKAAVNTSGRAENCLHILHKHSEALVTRADPNRLANVLLMLPAAGGVSPIFYLRLAGRLEQISSNELAARIYRRIYDVYPSSPDTEVALFRLGQLMERARRNCSGSTVGTPEAGRKSVSECVSGVAAAARSSVCRACSCWANCCKNGRHSRAASCTCGSFAACPSPSSSFST